jgi:hypothetical protein
MAIESPFIFYPRYIANLLYKHIKMAQLAWRFHWFKERLERDPNAKNYTDVALTPDSETAAEELEILAPHAVKNHELVTIDS